MTSPNWANRTMWTGDNLAMAHQGGTYATH